MWACAPAAWATIAAAGRLASVGNQSIVPACDQVAGTSNVFFALPWVIVHAGGTPKCSPRWLAPAWLPLAPHPHSAWSPTC